jgi:hypothetical protein
MWLRLSRNLSFLLQAELHQNNSCCSSSQISKTYVSIVNNFVITVSGSKCQTSSIRNIIIELTINSSLYACSYYYHFCRFAANLEVHQYDLLLLQLLLHWLQERLESQHRLRQALKQFQEHQQEQ